MGVLSLSVHIDGAGAVLCGSSDGGSGTDFKLHPDNSMLFWVLLFLKEEYYQKPAERLEAIRDWMRYDNSPYFYLEAYYLIWQDPYLLARLGSFEVRILYWTARWGIITQRV